MTKKKITEWLESQRRQALQLWREWRQAQETGEHLRISYNKYIGLEHQLDGFVHKEGATCLTWTRKRQWRRSTPPICSPSSPLPEERCKDETKYPQPAL